MKFPYREYISQFPGSSDFRLILRPVITIRIAGPRTEARWDALVDTGADETLLPLALAELLGVDLDRSAIRQAVGISGNLLTINYGDVELEIANDDHLIRWHTTVGFVDFDATDEGVIVLGHGGCLDYFTATFNGEGAELELKPNAHLPKP